MRRRSILRASTLASTVFVGAPWVMGCASSKPAEPSKPLQRIAVISVSTAYPLASAGFGKARLPSPRDVGGHVSSPLRRSFIVADMQTAMSAVRGIAFDPASELDLHLASALTAAGIDAVRVADAALIASLETETFGRFPDRVDSIVDVQVRDAGYLESGRAGGFYPWIQVRVRLRSIDPNARDLDWFEYYTDWRPGVDRRAVTIPKDLIFDQAGKLQTEAAAIRKGLQELMRQFVPLITDDVRRRAGAMPRLA
jgi:hypothetical protein